MEFLKEALNALPSVATSPLAFVGYLATILAWVWAVSRSRRLKLLLERLKEIPETDRASIIRHEMGAILPQNISADQWIRSKKHEYYFLAYVLLLVTFLGVAAISAWKGSTAADRSEAVQLFEARVRITLSGDWTNGKIPSSPGILVLREVKPALLIGVNLRPGNSKELELFTDDVVKIDSVVRASALLEYRCSANLGSWIFGTAVDTIRNFSMVSLDLTGLSPESTADGKVILETLLIEFFINGQRRSSYMKNPYKEIELHHPYTRIVWST